MSHQTGTRSFAGRRNDPFHVPDAPNRYALMLLRWCATSHRVACPRRWGAFMPATKVAPNVRITRAPITSTPHASDENSNAIVRRGPVRPCQADDRLNLLIEGKDRLWKRDLRISELVNVIIISGASALVMSQRWAWWAVAVASISAVACMWAFARMMTPREERLRRLMRVIARRRRLCTGCGYRLIETDRGRSRCPECGAAYESGDTRHLLGQELLHAFSARGRAIAALVIVYVLIWLALVARGSGMMAQGCLSMGLFAAFEIIHRVFIRRGRFNAGNVRRVRPTHVCGVELSCRGGLPRNCPACERMLTFGEIFVRPDPANLADRRILHLLHQATLLRWTVITLICGGLAAFLQCDDVLVRRLAFSLGWSGSIISLAIPMLIWVVGLGLFLRTQVHRNFAALKRLAGQLSPMCPGCNRDLSDVRVGPCCPDCHARIPVAVIRG